MSLSLTDVLPQDVARFWGGGCIDGSLAHYWQKSLLYCNICSPYFWIFALFKKKINFFANFNSQKFVVRYEAERCNAKALDRIVAGGPGPVVLGPWFWARGSGPVVLGPWFWTRGPGPVVLGPWSWARGPGPVVLGPRPLYLLKEHNTRVWKHWWFPYHINWLVF
jgi:hypothetical protein